MAIQFLDRDVSLPTSISEIIYRFEHDQWMMTDAERVTLNTLLNKLRPECAIEIGTYKAGSLKILSRFCKKVYTIDIDKTCRDEYGGKYPNVQFITGKSELILPKLLKEIKKSGEKLSFILIDGDHSEKGVRKDIENILRYTPTKPLYILMHDSFNPFCRKGIMTADWSSNSYVHMVEVDYIPGRFISKEEGDNYKEMWCGFALGILLQEPRDGDVRIHQNENLLFKTAYWRSIYPYKKIRQSFSFPIVIKRKLSNFIKEKITVIFNPK